MTTTDQTYREWANAARDTSDEAERTPCPGCGVDFDPTRHFYDHDSGCPLMVWVGTQVFTLPRLVDDDSQFYHQVVELTGLDPCKVLYQHRKAD